MRAQDQTSTTRLPQALRDQLRAQEDDGHYKATAIHVSRKDLRKAQRQGVKERRALHFSGHGSSQKRVSVTASSNVQPPQKKKKVSASKADTPAGIQTRNHAVSKSAPAASLENRSNKVFNSKKKIALPPSRVETEEDKYIEMLERKLGISKHGKGKTRYGTAFEEDGLMDLLTELDSLNRVDEQSSEHSDDAQGHETESSLSSGDEYSNDEWAGFGTEMEVEEENAPVEPNNFETPAVAGMQKNNKNGSDLPYVPPQLRKSQTSNHTSVPEKLAKQSKGLLNRLSEQNIASIIKDIEELYRLYRRFDVTSTLTTLMIESTCSHATLADTHLALYAAMIVSLHKIIGAEFGAFVVQEVVKAYQEYYTSLRHPLASTSRPRSEIFGKRCSNLLALLTELYNFQVISCVLMYDLIRSILDGELEEMNVELLLKVVKNSGSQLRQDDPSALKDIVELVQAKMSTQDNIPSSRTRFMMETLANLKNNKTRKQQTAEGGGNEIVARLQKFVKGIDKTRHVLAHEPLRVTLDDLHSAESKGKWWLVGAAWGGDPLLDKAATNKTPSEPTSTTVSQTALLALARKQGMNTDVRRSIFVVLMSSDDYIDACDRMTQLNLTEVQHREIIRVLLHCCGNEKSYNPYYTLIGQHLCRLSHNHRITFQFALWDFLRSMGESGIGGTDIADSFDEDSQSLRHLSQRRKSNYAKAYGWWIAKHALSIAILKPINFTVMKTATKSFLADLLAEIFRATQTTSLVTTSLKKNNAIFDRSALEVVLVKCLRLPELTKGLIYFLNTALGDHEQYSQDEVVSWGIVTAKSILREGLETLI